MPRLRVTVVEAKGLPLWRGVNHRHISSGSALRPPSSFALLRLRSASLPSGAEGGEGADGGGDVEGDATPGTLAPWRYVRTRTAFGTQSPCWDKVSEIRMGAP
jgi:hypothetical protein